MAKVKESIAAAVEQLIYSLPSFGDTFVENTNEGLKVCISGADESVHAAYAEYFYHDFMDVVSKADHILITEKLGTDGLTNAKLNDIYKYIITKNNAELTDDFNKLVLPFLGDSVDKLSIDDSGKMAVVQGGLATVLKAHEINHNDFVIDTSVTESTVTEVMPNVSIGDTIEIVIPQDIKDNFGKYADKLGDPSDLALWLNNGGHIEIEITDTLADTINGISVDVRFNDGTSVMPNTNTVGKSIAKFFTDEDMKKHLGSKKLFEEEASDFGFVLATAEQIEANSGLSEGDMLAAIDGGTLVYSPATKMIRVFPTDDVAYAIEPVLNENDANRVLIVVNDSENDSAVLVDKFQELDMSMIMEESTNEEFTKDEFVSIVDAHNVSGNTISDSDIDDNMVSEFNKKFKEFLQTYPDFEIFKNDYDGDEDDKFIQLLIDTLSTGNLSIV